MTTQDPGIYSMEAEQSVLGAILLDNSVMPDVDRILSTGDFYAGAHRDIFQAARAMLDQGEAVDAVTLKHHLEKTDALALVGGVAYLCHLVETVPTAANATTYARIVRAKAQTRDLAAQANNILKDIADPSRSRDVAGLLGRASKRMADLAEDATDPDGQQPLFVPQSCKQRGWHNTSPPARRWVIRDIVPVGVCGLLLGPGGVGKSKIALSMAATVAGGVPAWLGKFDVDEPGAVLLLAGEDDLHEGHRRLAREIPSLPFDLQDRAWDNLYFETRVGLDSALTAISQTTKQAMRTDILDGLVESARQIPDLRLIYLDPGSRFRGGNEIDANDTTFFVQAIEHLAKQTGAAVVVSHHHNKASATNGTGDSQHAARGSSALIDGVRFAINLTRPTAKEAQAQHMEDGGKRGYAKLSNSKNNYALSFHDLFLDYRSGVVRIADMVMDMDAFERVTSAIRDHADKGQRFSPRAFRDAFGGVGKLIGMAQHPLDDLIRQAVHDGMLEIRRRGRVDELWLPGEG